MALRLSPIQIGRGKIGTDGGNQCSVRCPKILNAIQFEEIAKVICNDFLLEHDQNIFDGVEVLYRISRPAVSHQFATLQASKEFTGVRFRPMLLPNALAE